MSAALIGACAWLAVAFGAAGLLGASLTDWDKVDPPEPEWPSGDEAWLLDQPFEVLTADEQVRQLERTWLL